MEVADLEVSDRLGEIDFSNHNTSTARGAIKYTLMTSKQIGVMTIAADTNYN